MSSNNILTVRLPEEELTRLDQLAALQQRSRSLIVQETIREMLDSNEDFRLQNLESMKSRLKPAILEQCELLSRLSVADEHRRF